MTVKTLMLVNLLLYLSFKSSEDHLEADASMVTSLLKEITQVLPATVSSINVKDLE